MPLPCESWPLVILVNFTCLWQCQGYSRQWESENICRWSMPVVYMFKCSLGLLIFPMDFPIVVQWSCCFVLFFAMEMVCYLMYVHFFSVKKPEFVLNISYWPVIDCVCVVLSATLLSRWMEAVKKRKGLWKWKPNPTHKRIQSHTYTHVSILPPPLLPSLCVGRAFV